MPDDQHQAYVAVFVTVEFPEVQSIEQRLDHDAAELKLAAVGGNIGLYGPDETYAKWPADDLDSAVGLASQVLSSVELFGEPFWRSFPDVHALRELLDSKHPYTVLQQSRWYLRVAARLASQGLESAMAYVAEHPDAFREHGGVPGMRRRLEPLASRAASTPPHGVR